ncbi:MAG: imelysin family protein [Crocinitomicaceae bacterium]|nr:imelysin family protein [Crocinitomicaceae bacterium]MBK8925147.1 imelysin family protein [Crocinitomicaceae bacterium]
MYRSSFLLILTATIFSACKDDNKTEFDRKAMLSNMASAVIIPAFTDLNNALALLITRTDEFNSNPNTTTLTALRQQYVECNVFYQHCAMYSFGPAQDYGIKGAFNTFPTDTTKIEANITAGTYTLGSVANTTAIGFPAIDYLLYFGGDAFVIANFSTDALASNRKIYLTDLVTKMKSELQPVLDQWNGGYKTIFTSADGTDVSSSCSYLLNEFVKDIELVKNAKIGIPSGQQTGGATLPAYVEGYYSGLSNTFALENLYGLETCFVGGNGLGFDDYIRHQEGDDVTNSLADQIIAQFDVCESLVNTLVDPLSATVDTDWASVNNAYLELKKLVILTKTDMTSVLGLLITYQDSDGD